MEERGIRWGEEFEKWDALFYWEKQSPVVKDTTGLCELRREGIILKKTNFH